LYRYFVSQSSEFYRHNLLCCFPTSVYCLFIDVYFVMTQSGNFWIHPLAIFVTLLYTEQLSILVTQP